MPQANQSDLKPYQRDFIRFAIQSDVLKFGEYTLKSGRVSPYFYNAGLFNTGSMLARLGQYYAAAIMDQSPPCDLLFGPAYKGIPIAAATAVALSREPNWDLKYAFNRKEAKDHGEGGTIVGAELAGRILIIDDVITAGTAIREVMSIMKQANANPVGVIVALDRQERGKGSKSAIQEVVEAFSIPVMSIVTLTNLISYLEQGDPTAGNDELFMQHNVERIKAYQQSYGLDYPI